jgi:glycosyltransferase involved in cell wall biosynthesis
LIKSRVAIFLHGGIYNYSPSMINFVELLTENYQVDLFSVEKINPKRLNKNIRNKLIPKKPMASSGQVRYQDGFRYLIWKKATEFRKSLRYNIIRKYRYRFVVAFDPIMLKIVNDLFVNQEIVFHSLELYLPTDDNFDLSYKNIDYQRVNKLIIQSREREQALLSNYSFRLGLKTYHLPVCFNSHKNTLYENRNEKLKILYSGSVSKKLGETLIIEAHKIKNTLFTFHFICSIELKEYFKNLVLHQKSANIIVSNTFFQEFNELEDFVSNCDVGIAWFENDTINDKTAGLSSGKLALYTKYGMPVITNNYDSFKNVFESEGAGICIDTLTELSKAIEEIKTNFDNISTNARRVFDKYYNFQKHEKDLLEFLEKK